ncbi:helix-turn-helix domain-containing protein [Thalassoglobus polymorphus]|uniref:DNA-binding protein Fis n=1 Tax=Thalassoglobus polymorphus TaxID=2527994 RepID=A0A517QIK9_9PLAN|nr:DNA-binding protein Fis [Thalassoglobus polymorphus]
MKRVVIQVSSTEQCSENERTATTKVETVLPEAIAELVLATVMNFNSQASTQPSERIVEFLVKQELENVDDPSGLFDRLIANVERTLLTLIYAECDHVQTKTALRLGIDRNTLHKKLSKYNLLTNEARVSKETP